MDELAQEEPRGDGAGQAPGRDVVEVGVRRLERLLVLLDERQLPDRLAVAFAGADHAVDMRLGHALEHTHQEVVQALPGRFGIDAQVAHRGCGMGHRGAGQAECVPFNAAPVSGLQRPGKLPGQRLLMMARTDPGNGGLADREETQRHAVAFDHAAAWPGCRRQARRSVAGMVVE